MFNITPNTYIKLVRFNVTKEHQIDFPSQIDQYNYFAGLGGYVLENFTYQRKDHVLHCVGSYDDLCQYNYLFYQNGSFSNKVYFCYIKNMTYINDDCTDIEIEEDVFQTWQFDVQYKRSFVEREHVADDTIGKHTINEGLGFGDYVAYSVNRYMGFDDLIFMLLVTKWDDQSDTDGSFNIGGIPYVGGAILCRNAQAFQDEVAQYAGAGIPDAIYGAYVIPISIVNCSDPFKEGSVLYETYHGQTSTLIEDFSISMPYSFGSYIPKNNKLHCFPYQYLLLSNNSGASNIYNYERFKDVDDCQFEISGVPTMGCGIKIAPINYDYTSVNANEEQGIMAGKFPPLNWSVDEFTVWSTQNMLNITTEVIQSAINVGLGASSIASGNADVGASQIGSGIGQMLGTFKDVYLHKEFDVPSAHGNLNAGDLNTSKKTNTFFFYKMGIKEEIAKSIDNFFTMYGYRVNELKNINFKTRRYWNYIKTTEAIIESPVVPEKSLNNFKALFNNGITFWHDPYIFMDYNQPNDII